ncbi:MAG TPA: FtsQ-type POTRA domain-containing protein [Bryobacteraceae bacterium]|jgi:cell division protein FtsQ|nr:FtsQ-type POTRA domain-containing protein [Bryobacteraceae bacterium]
MAKTIRIAQWNWRLWLRAGMWTALTAATAIGARALTRLAKSDPHFVLDRDAGVTMNGRDFTVLGLNHASRWRVARVFESDFGKNIFSIPIDERRRKLMAVDWIERASVSRVWPNRLIVRVWERTPVAYVNLTPPGVRNQNARLALIDAYGVLLDRPQKLDFSSPILSGVSESQTELQRAERVRSYMRLMSELGELGKRLSEVDVSVQDNVRVSLGIQGKAIDLSIGDRNFKERVQDFLDNYAEISRKSGGSSSFDLRLDDRITTREQ